MRIQLKWLIAAVAVPIAVIPAWAQAPEPSDVIVHREVKIMPGGPPAPFMVDVLGSEMSFSDKAVKGAPYAAESVTETTQILSDGNRITRKSGSTVYRDTEGRTRREETMPAIGPWASGGEPQSKTIFIHDPVAGTSYVLDPQTRTARKLMVRSGKFEMAAAPSSGDRVFVYRQKGTQEQGVIGEKIVSFDRKTAAERGTAAGEDVKKEPLGKQTIEGVQAEGTRSTVTIPAGAIGNERPIESVSERWYSPELQTVIMSKHNDPRFGETVYRLTNIQRGDQPQSLFEVPADYAVKDEPGPVRLMRHSGPEDVK